ncbi:hypothetical protein [Leifsonia aquatica]|uniref:hypothetical protein n=1 Tax=Leifsonia aquatica TaxID=144185 RepID=UPI000A6E9BAD|nr:hypothetical protein [Leifsonia aquatica]
MSQLEFDDRERKPLAILVPTLTKQCWGFMIGSALFALGSAPGFGQWAGASTSNLCYFFGAWFFTFAALLQLLMSGRATVPVSYGSGTMVRAAWLAAATQFFGTLLFNVSTSAAVGAKALATEKHFVWTPDAAGSVAFLISGVFVIVAFTRSDRFWNPRSVGWWSGQINFLGCVAFGVSAVGAYILANGDSANDALANGGTFVGALCFLVASLIVLPQWSRTSAPRG